MHLTREQERALNGEFGWAYAKALEIIVKVGESLGADRLISISHAHISGVSYSNIGEAGLEFLRDFHREKPRFRVYTTINPGCVDYGMLSKVIDNKFVEKQRQIDDVLVGMGARPVFTCIPYYHRPPMPHENLSWGESSAAIFANSFFGARTNREGGPLALASAITGLTYYYGLHKDENRVARVLVKLSPKVADMPLSLTGLWVGENVRKIPFITLERKPLEEVKALLASMAASGFHAMAVLENITPRNTYGIEIEETLTIEVGDVERYIAEKPSGDDEVLGYIGCPHTHPSELILLKKLIEKYKSPRRGRLLVTIPVEFLSTYEPLIKFLVSRGVDIASGTCPVVSTLSRRFDIVLTNSGKAYFYLRKIHGLRVGITGIRQIVESVYR